MAALLGVTTPHYIDIENGNVMLTHKQARQLGKLFNVNGNHFYAAALQLDRLLAKDEIIKVQKYRISQLKLQLHNLQTSPAVK